MSPVRRLLWFLLALLLISLVVTSCASRTPADQPPVAEDSVTDTATEEAPAASATVDAAEPEPVPAPAAPAPAVPQVATSSTRVAPASAVYRHRVEQATARAWGVHASAARLAAQLHQESAFKADAKSGAGAQGIAQFMPATAKWIATVYPDELANFDPWNAQQAIMAAALYDRWLYDRVRPLANAAVDTCSRWAFALRGYNGGEGWLTKERTLAKSNGADPDDWLAVEPYRVRAQWAHKENTQYPRRILLTLEPAYIAAGWQGVKTC